MNAIESIKGLPHFDYAQYRQNSEMKKAHKMKKYFTLLLILLTLLISFSCVPSSHIIVGDARSPIDLSQVKLYLDYPEQYEKVALIEASNRLSFTFLDQSKMDKVVERLKMEAAKLGANGVVIENTDNKTEQKVQHNLETTIGQMFKQTTLMLVGILISILDNGINRTF